MSGGLPARPASHRNPAAADPPNPAEITHFVSLGEAKAALQEGMRRCQALLAQLDPQGAPAS